MRILLALMFVFAASPSWALSCKNDYAGVTGCAANASSAGDCETLGYSTAAVINCEHYIYCPFNTAYKRCVSETTEPPAATCTTGSLNPTCETGYAPYKIGETTDGQMCLECQATTCSTSNRDYKTKDEYFTGTSFPLYQQTSVQLVSSPTEKTSQTCYYSCGSNVTLKPISSCAIGDVMIWVRGDDQFYCTTYKSSTPNNCTYYTQIGVVGYISGSNVWAVRVTSHVSFAGLSNWPKGKNCHTLYNQAKSSTNYAYNSRVLTGNVSTSFSTAGCRLYGGYIGQSTNLNSAVREMYYGIPNKTMLTNIAKNYTAINNTLKAMSWPEIPLGSACNTGLVLYDSGFTINYNGSSSSNDIAYSYPGMLGGTSFTECSTPVALGTGSGFGIFVFNPNQTM